MTDVLQPKIRSVDAGARSGHDRVLSISEAVLLAVVTIVAAWSGYSAAKWGTDSSLALAKASEVRDDANRAYQGSLSRRTTDATMFNAWFAAYISGDESGMRVARKRFSPQEERAFEAWLATNPFTTPHAPGGPQDMPEYVPAGEAESKVLDHRADVLYEHGQHAAETSDDYVRITVILASILFLVGISTQFSIRGVRYGLISVGALLLAVAVVEILTLPGLP